MLDGLVQCTYVARAQSHEHAVITRLLAQVHRVLHGLGSFLTLTQLAGNYNVMYHSPTKAGAYKAYHVILTPAWHVHVFVARLVSPEGVPQCSIHWPTPLVSVQSCIEASKHVTRSVTLGSMLEDVGSCHGSSSGHRLVTVERSAG